MTLPTGLRFISCYLATFLLVEIILGAGIWLSLRQNLFEIADSALDGQTADVQRLLEARKDLPVAQLQAEIAATYQAERSRDYLQISDAGGNLIYRSSYLGQHPLPAVALSDLDRPVYEIRKWDAERFRFLSRQVEAGGRVYVVRIGHPMQQESATLSAVRGEFLWLGPLLALIASIAGYWLSRRKAADGAH